MSGARLRTALVLAGVLAVVSPFLFRFAFFLGDFHFVFEPLRGVLGAELRNGNIWYTTRLGSGQPLMASPFAAALYPPNFLFALPGLRPATLLTALCLAHLLWGALGTALLARRRGASPAAALLAGAVAGLSGIPFSSAPFVLILMTASWLPWVLLAARRMQEEPGAKSAALVAASVALLVLAGDPFMCAACGLLAGVFVLCDTAPRSVRRLVPVAAAALLGLLAVSPFLLAASRAASVSTRGTPFPKEVALTGSLHPAELLGLALPLPFGDLMRLSVRGNEPPGVPSGLQPIVLCLYVGLVPLALAALALRARRPSATAPLVALAALALLALGRHTPLYPLLLDLAKPLAATRYPAKWLFAAAVPLGLLAGEGLDAAGAGARRVARLALLSLVVPAVAIALALGLAPRRAGVLVPSALRSTLVPAGAALVATLLARRGREELLPGALAGLVALDLVSVGSRVAPTVDAALYDAPPRAAAAILRDRPVRVWADDSPEAYGVVTHDLDGAESVAATFRPQRERMTEGIGAAYGLSLAIGGDLERLAPAPYRDLRLLVEALPPHERSLLLSAAGVTHVVSLLDRSGPGLEEIGRFDARADRPLTVLRNRGALPLVRIVPSIAVHEGRAGLLALLREAPDGFLESAALVDAALLGKGFSSAPTRPGPGGSRIFSPPAAGAAPRWEVRAREERGGGLLVSFHGPAGFLVVANAWSPQLEARVDGRPAPILLANVAFLAIPVPPGEHEVRVSYEPWRGAR